MSHVSTSLQTFTVRRASYNRNSRLSIKCLDLSTELAVSITYKEEAFACLSVITGQSRAGAETASESKR